MWQCMPVWRLFFLHSVGAHIFIWRVVLLFFRFTVSLFGCLYPLCSIDWAFFTSIVQNKKFAIQIQQTLCAQTICLEMNFFSSYIFFLNFWLDMISSCDQRRTQFFVFHQILFISSSLFNWFLCLFLVIWLPYFTFLNMTLMALIALLNTRQPHTSIICTNNDEHDCKLEIFQNK